jgi:WD40 repeat protein
MSEQTATPSTDQSAFAALAALKAAHADLTQRRRASPEPPTLLDDIAAFVRRGQASGALLDDDDERAVAQSLLNYWANILYRAGREPPDATLAEFDIRLAPALPDKPCPYVGLDAFHESEYDLFFGRRQLVDELIERLKTSRLLAVVGSSGSGKSSLVRAGLIAALRDGALPGSAGWRYLPPIMPGSRSMESLERALAAENAVSRKDDDPTAPVVLVVDQFEELFTLCANPQERAAFAQCLLDLIESHSPHNIVVLTMRIDFEENIAKLPALQVAFQAARIQVTALSAGDLRAAIEEPARKVGLKFEAGVVDALVHDILGERVGLPLLQFTLLKLWEQRERNRVTWAAYQRLGNAREALARSADAFYQKLLLEEQLAAQRILLRMVRPGTDLEVTSNRIQRATLYPGGEARERIDRVLDKLIAARLVRQTTGESPDDIQIEVAHEALIRNWPRLMDWIEQDRDVLRQRQRLTAAAEQWQTLNHDPAALLRGALLDEALRYEDLNLLEQAYVEASHAAQETDAREREAARERELEQVRALAVSAGQRAEEQAAAARRLRQRAYVLAIMTGLAIVAMIAASVFLVQSRINAATASSAAAVAQTQRDEAESSKATAVSAQALTEAARKAQLLAFQALSAPDPELGLLLAIEAARLSRDNLVEAALRQAVQSSHVRLRLGVQPNSQASWSPDQRRILTIDADKVQIWDATTGQALATLCCHNTANLPSSELPSVAHWSPDGLRALMVSTDSAVRIWDVASGKQALILSGGTNAVILDAAWSPNGQRVVTRSDDGMARVWDAADGRQLFVLTDPTTITPAWSPHGSYLLAADGDGTARIVDAATGGVIHSFNALPDRAGLYRFDVWSTSWSFDEQHALTAGTDGTVHIWGIDGTLISTLDDPSSDKGVNRSGAPISPINQQVIFSPNGQRVAAIGADDIVRIWNTSTPDAPPLRLLGHTAQITRIAWEQDSRRLASASADKTARVWDTTAGRELLVLRGHGDAVQSVAWSADRQRLLTASIDGTMRVWSTNLGEERAVKLGPDGATAAAFSPDRSILSWGTENGDVLLWRVSESDWKLQRTLSGHTGPIRSMVFSKDGQLLASLASDRTLYLWRVADGTLVHSIQLKSPMPLPPTGYDDIYAVAFTSDGTAVATAVGSAVMQLWRVNDGSLILEKPVGATSIAFSADDKIVATGGLSGTVEIRDTATLDPLGDPLLGHTGMVRSLAFSADGTTLAAGGDDKNILILDVATRQPHSLALVGHAGAVVGITWSDDGGQILSAADDGTARVWDIALGVQRSVLRGGDAALTTAAWSTRELRIITAGADGAARFYAASFDDLVALAQSRMTRSLKPEELEQALGATLPATPVQPLPTSMPAIGPAVGETAQIAPTTTALEAPTPTSAAWVETASLKHPVGVRAVAFSPDNTLLASAAEDGAVRVWNTADGTLNSTLTGHRDVVDAVAFSPDGALLASASDDKTVRLWDVATGRIIRVLDGHIAQVWAVAFSPDGTTLASGSNDRTIRLWNVADGSLLHTLTGHTVGIWSVAFAPDGKTLASAASDNLAFRETEVRLWNVADGRPAATLAGHTRGVLSVGFAPDGTLASGSVDQRIILWDVGARAALRTLIGHTDNVYSVAFSPDSQVLVSGSLDNSVRLWRVGDGTSLQTLAGHAGRVWSVAFAPDGATLASASADGSVHLWRAK